MLSQGDRGANNVSPYKSREGNARAILISLVRGGRKKRLAVHRGKRGEKIERRTSQRETLSASGGVWGGACQTTSSPSAR